MQKAEPPGRPHPPADLRRRILARSLDFAVALAPLVLVPSTHALAGLVLSLALFLCADRLFGPGRSLGKRLAGLRCILLPSGKPANLFASIRRNAIFAIALLPGFALRSRHSAWIAVLLLCASLPEARMVSRPLVRDPGRRRLGDLWAGTQVVDASIALPLPRGEAIVEAPFAPREGASALSLELDPAAVDGPFREGAGRRLAEGAACASP